MDGKFTLSIDMGNAAMLSRRDLARALEGLAEKIKTGGMPLKDPDGFLTTGNIRDLNGNTVGQWTYEVIK